MTTIKRISAAAGLGAALALAVAGPAAADGSSLEDAKKLAKDDNVTWITGEDQFCNAKGYIVVIVNSCNGNNGGSGNGNVGD